jgi:acyl-CoA thioester hydrolase
MSSKIHHSFPLRVYYDSTDAGGMVYHSNYLVFAEHARSEFLRSVGVGQQTLLETEGFLFVVRRLSVDYKAPAKLDDALIVESTVTKLQGARVEFIQNITRDGKILVTLQVEIAFIRSDGVPKKIPADLIEKLTTAKLQH